MNFNSYIQPLLYKIKDCKLSTFPYPYAEKEDLLPEETLYEKFIPNKDTALFKTWHSSSWEDKLRLLDKFLFFH